jgi:hemin uptake protein HemP
MICDRPDERAEKTRDTPHESQPARGAPEPVVRYDVAELLRGGREAILDHGGAQYRLRITANGRLILTK